MLWGLAQFAGVLAVVALFLALGHVLVPLCIRWSGKSARDVENRFYGDRSSVLDRKNVLLLTAHPDDESMFFVPSLLALYILLSRFFVDISFENGLNKRPKFFESLRCLILRNPQTDVNLFILCLSKGIEEGETRVKELEAAAKRLGVKTTVVYGYPAPGTLLVGVPRFQDGFDQHWPKEDIAAVVDSYAIRWNIHAIISFDDKGVSSHPNHIALHEGLKYYLNTVRQADPINIWTLKTEVLAFKYSSWVGPVSRFLEGTLGTEEATHIDFLNPDVGMVWSAMSEHSSQLMWFRKLFLMFSSYVYYNRLIMIPRPLPKAKKTS